MPLWRMESQCHKEVGLIRDEQESKPGSWESIVDELTCHLSPGNLTAGIATISGWQHMSVKNLACIISVSPLILHAQLLYL